MDKKVKEILVKELHKLIEDGKKVKLLDVRHDFEHKEMRIANSLFLDIGDLSLNKLSSLGLNGTDKIVVYCRTGRRSETAARLMGVLGYLDASNLVGGILDWQEAGFEVEGDLH